MKIQNEQRLTLTHEEVVELLIAGLKAKFRRRVVSKGLDESKVTVKFTENIEDGVEPGALESCEIFLPATTEEAEAEADAAEGTTATA